MFNIKNIVSKITERGKESQPNSPGRTGQEDDLLSKQGAEGFLCPKCMKALPSPEELQLHYESYHDSDKEQHTSDLTSSSGAGFLGLHQEVGERYKVAERYKLQEGTLISQKKLSAEIHGITDTSELQKSLMDALESKAQVQLEKEHLERKTAELAQANAAMKAANDEDQSHHLALKERLKIVEAQLAHRESIDDAAVLRQELVQVQRVMDKLTREREGERDLLQSERDLLQCERDQLQSERDQLQAEINILKVIHLEDDTPPVSKRENELQTLVHLKEEELKQNQTLFEKVENENKLLRTKTETLEEMLNSERDKAYAANSSLNTISHEVQQKTAERDEIKAIYNESLITLDELKDEKNKKIEEFTIKMAAHDTLLQKNAQEITLKNSQLEELQNENKSLQQALGKSVEEFEAMKKQLSDKYRTECAQLEQRQAELVTQIEAGEGANAAVQQYRVENLKLQSKLREQEALNDEQRKKLLQFTEDLENEKSQFRTLKETAEVDHHNALKDMSALHQRLNIVESDLKNKEVILGNTKETLTTVTLENNKLLNEVHAMKLELECKNQELEDNQELIQALETNSNNLSYQLSVTSDELKREAGTMYNTLQLHIQGIEEKSAEKDDVISDLRTKNVEFAKDLNKLQESLNDTRTKLAACQKEINDMEIKLASVETINFELQKSITEVSLSKEKLKDETVLRVAELTSVIDDLTKKIEGQEQEISHLIAHHDELSKKAETVHEAKIQELEKEKEGLISSHVNQVLYIEGLVVELEKAVQDKDKELDQVNRELESMERLDKSHQAVINELQVTSDNNLKIKLDEICSMQVALDEVAGEKLALEAQLETCQAEQKSLLEKFYQSCSEHDAQRRTVDDLRRRLEDSQSALHELGRENQILQLELEKLLGRKWTEDADAVHCQLCNKEFSIIVRKHHCRNCGQIFCNECSNKMAPLANNKKPVRVCNSCYNELASK